MRRRRSLHRRTTSSLSSFDAVHPISAHPCLETYNQAVPRKRNIKYPKRQTAPPVIVAVAVAPFLSSRERERERAYYTRSLGCRCPIPQKTPFLSLFKPLYIRPCFLATKSIDQQSSPPILIPNSSFITQKYPLVFSFLFLLFCFVFCVSCFAVSTVNCD